MPVNIAALSVTIDREVATVTPFVEMLRAEQTALVRGENERVAEYADPKAKYLIELTRLGGERNRLLAAGGYSTDRAGMERCLRDYAAQAMAVGNAWRQLLTLTQAAHAANTTNGMIIATRLQHTQRALNAIFSSARMPGAYGTYGAYGADGNTVSLRTTQQLAVA